MTSASHEIAFAKFEGCGNDYIYVVLPDLDDDVAQLLRENASAIARQVADRHFGIGSDGLVLLDDDEAPAVDVRMLMYNADGSRGETCGNALRCIGKLIGDRNPSRTELVIATDVGSCPVRLTRNGDCGAAVTHVAVDMGEPSGTFSDVPLEIAEAEILREPASASPGEVAVRVEIEGLGATSVRGSPVSMGNPHFVVFVDDPENHAVRELLERPDTQLAQVGRPIEAAACFPVGANVEFVANRDGVLHQRTWERGSGETLACGSGACAVAVAARARGFAEPGSPVRVMLLGGELALRVEDRVTMYGPARRVFSGSFRVARASGVSCYDAFQIPPAN